MSAPRADTALAELGLFPSREQAKAAILAGRIHVGGVAVAKPGQPLPPGEVEVEPAREFVSRGGHKLCGALDAFGVDVAGARALDVGASTGGFTDCLLKRGASTVTALDVGYGQLAWSLRNDERVRVLERTNIRKVSAESLGGPYDIVTVDVSFVGLLKVLPHVVPALAGGGQVLVLVKPQFEAGKARVGRRGVVRDPEVHADVLREVADGARAQGWVVRGATFSPMKGPEGNVEFWLRLAREGEDAPFDARGIVASAGEALGG